MSAACVDIMIVGCSQAAHAKAIKSLVTAVAKLEKRALLIEHSVAKLGTELREQIDGLEVSVAGACVSR